MTFNHRVILRTISIVLIFEGIAMLIPLISAVYYNEGKTASAFFFIALCCIGFGMIMNRYLSYSTLRIKTREGYFIAFLCWIVSCMIGTLPYLLSGNHYSFIDCLFESIAGWTTTGARVLDINAMPNSLLLWKSICNWLGGMGILILTLSVFPVLGAHGQKMAAAEVPGPELEKMTARMGETAKITFSLYITMTVVELCLLLPSGINPFDALLNTLSTISTAGVVNLNNDVSLHFTPYVKSVFTIFSIVGSINFMMYFFIYVGKWKKVVQNVELRTYLSILAISSLVIAIALNYSGSYSSFTEALVDSVTQTVSFGSTSGFTVGEINEWPSICKTILLILMFIGGCGNSTSGSIKVIRLVVYFKLIMRGVYKRIHPKAMKPIMIQGKPISADAASSITVFMMLYFLVYIFACLLLSLENQDMETTMSAALAAFSNNGTGFGALSNANFGIFSTWGKLCSAILMLAGRLEMYAVIVLFSRSFWNSDRARS